MMKWIFGLLVLLNLVFFAVMQWGSALTVDANNPPLQAAFNADKIKIVSMVAPAVSVAVAASAPVSAVPVASAVVTVAPPPVVAVVPPPAKLSCMEWGEFSAADLRRADKALAALKLGDRLKLRAVEYNNGYWIYIAPVKAQALLKKKVALLKKLGVEDYFVVQEAGVWHNSISLGVFKSEESAKKYLAKLHERGVKSAKMGERASKLKFTVFVLSRLDSSASSQVATLRKDFPDSEIRQIPCN